MPSYSNERREAVVAKLLPPSNLSVREVSKQEGISEPTVSVFVNEVARFFHATFFRAVPVPADAWSRGGFNPTSCQIYSNSTFTCIAPPEN